MDKTLTNRRSSNAPAGAREPVALRLRDGRRRDRPLSLDGHAALLTELIHANRPGYVEVVGARRDPSGDLTDFDRSHRERFVDAGDREAFLAQVRDLRDGEGQEVFLTPPTLDVPVAGNDSVVQSGLAWVDVDEPRRLARLRGFPHTPHAVVASGSGGVHAYWLLAAPVSGERCEEVNRKLAAALGADLASCNRGRILRVPGTFNWKKQTNGAPTLCRVLMCDLAKPGYEASALSAGLRDPREPRPLPTRRRQPAPPLSKEPWVDMEAADYYRIIFGREPRSDMKVRCPNLHHEDKRPSAHLYRGPGRGWFCFACGAGGSAIDMVAARRGLPTGRQLEGAEFVECIDELRRIFGLPCEDRPTEGRH
jgi:hypothetical protein